MTLKACVMNKAASMLTASPGSYGFRETKLLPYNIRPRCVLIRRTAEDGHGKI
jgi:hypothetical protein